MIQTDLEIVSLTTASQAVQMWLDHRPHLELQREHKADLASSFEDMRVLKNLYFKSNGLPTTCLMNFSFWYQIKNRRHTQRSLYHLCSP